MNLDTQSITFILGLLGLGGIIFSVYNHFQSPQVLLERRQALAEEGAENKAQLLSQQVQWQKEATERRFAELSQRIVESTAMAQNHIHTIDTKVDGLSSNISALNSQIIKLGTILEERIPKK